MVLAIEPGVDAGTGLRSWEWDDPALLELVRALR